MVIDEQLQICRRVHFESGSTSLRKTKGDRPMGTQRNPSYTLQLKSTVRYLTPLLKKKRREKPE